MNTNQNDMFLANKNKKLIICYYLAETQSL